MNQSFSDSQKKKLVHYLNRGPSNVHLKVANQSSKNSRLKKITENIDFYDRYENKSHSLVSKDNDLKFCVVTHKELFLKKYL